MLFRGRTHKFGNDVNTDYIIASKYKSATMNMQEMAKHVMEDADPTFVKKVRPGDFVVAGRNFGLGSSREHAPLVLKMAGVHAVLAKSFARIFFRNAINLGLPVLICDTDKISDGDTLEIDFNAATVKDITDGHVVTFGRIPDVMLRILNEGGLLPYIEKYGDISV